MEEEDKITQIVAIFSPRKSAYRVYTDNRAYSPRSYTANRVFTANRAYTVNTANIVNTAFRVNRVLPLPRAQTKTNFATIKLFETKKENEF